MSEVTGGQTFLHAAQAVGALLALTFLAVGMRDFCKTILEAQESRYRFYLTSCLEEKSMAMFYQTYEKKQTRDLAQAGRGSKLYDERQGAAVSGP